MAKINLTFQEVTAIRAFLTYLNKHYSKWINNDDVFLIAAVGAWVYQESGGLKHVIGNNPFNIRSSPLQSGTRATRGNGHFAVFSSMSRGFEAAAYLLIHGNKAYGYQIALNALKNGGNQAAVDFLAALAMSSWDAAHYGAQNWSDAYNPKINHLYRVYLNIGGLQLADPKIPPPGSKPRPRHKPPGKHELPPRLPHDLTYTAPTRGYLDPYAAKDLYHRRHDRNSVSMDGTKLKR
jgi:hypothetical protein